MSLKPFAAAGGTPRAVEASSFDQQIMARIEATRKEHVRLRDARVRAEGDVARIDAELAELMPHLQQTYGVASIEELRAQAATQREVVLRETKAYEEAIQAASRRLAAVSEQQA